MVPIDLSGRVALVTGGGRGIGRAAASSLAEAGCDVVLNWRSHAEAAAQVAAHIESFGRTCLSIQADIADSAAVDAMVARAHERFGRIDILVSNAGAGIAKPVTEVSDAEHTRVFDVNVKGLVACARAVLPGMKARGQGRVIAISSVVGRSGRAFRSTAPTYAGAKAAILGYVKGMALECGPHGITVNAVCPGWIDWSDEWGDKHGAAPEALRAQARALIPLGRTGTAEDVAGTVLFLASDHAAYVTGATIDVNGGLYMA